MREPPRILTTIDFSKKIFTFASYMEFAKGTHMVSTKSNGDIIQFSVLLDGKSLSYNNIIKLCSTNEITISAFSFLENFDTTVMRFVVNYPDCAQKILSENRVVYYTTNIVGIDLDQQTELLNFSKMLFAAEIKLHYIYSFLSRPHGKIGLLLQTENNEFTKNMLSSMGFKVLSQDDIGR